MSGINEQVTKARLTVIQNRLRQGSEAWISGYVEINKLLDDMPDDFYGGAGHTLKSFMGEDSVDNAANKAMDLLKTAYELLELMSETSTEKIIMPLTCLDKYLECLDKFGISRGEP